MRLALRVRFDGAMGGKAVGAPLATKREEIRKGTMMIEGSYCLSP